MILRSAARNRLWLAVIGLVSVLAGSVLLLVGTGLAAELEHLLPDSVVLPSTGQTVEEAVATLDWMPAVVLTVSVLVALGVLVWLIRGVPRPPRSPELQLQQDGRTGVTVLPAKVLASAVEEAAEDVPDVVSADAHIGGQARRPQVMLVVEAEERGDLAELLDRLIQGVCGDLARSLETRLGSVSIVLDPVLRTRASSTATVTRPSPGVELRRHDDASVAGR
ncbi:hypothetical protein Q7C18_15150 [Nesterenkonia sp. CL21]|uniref:hypothetical protein n=1 Tax=Nesterenkonia sp. CL21 TaxID=3064894 RepID=UPI00287976EE|nr:hypothetical protein [Nesterenkonia sp. CL21]MDS2174041.1 hypothetical protein [Nesterenkonia sp. CL21]